MKIFLIDPKGIVTGLNSGLAYIAGSLIERGHNVRVLDFNNMNGNDERRFEELKDADIVGISIKSFTRKESLDLADKVRKKNKNALLICGGPHITLDGVNFIKQNHVFNLGVFCEGERTILDLASGVPLDKLKGIVYKNNGNLILGNYPDSIENLDELPFPNYDCFDSIVHGINSYPLLTSRGCPYKCKYCSVSKISGGRWRFRTPGNIMEELKRAKGKYKIKRFHVCDDNFTLHMERAKDWCRKLIAEYLNLKWSCPNGIRADRVDEEMIDLMRKSGCESISIGIESGVEEVFEKINKGEHLEDVIKTVNLAKGAGIRITGFFIIGLPGSTFELDKKSIKFAKRIGVDTTMWNNLVPYPGTELWDWVQKNGTMLIDWKEGFHFGSEPTIVFETKDYPAEERLKAFYLANLATRSYSTLVDQNEPKIKAVKKLIKIILKYDPGNLFVHLGAITAKLIRKVLRLSIRYTAKSIL